jgi:hypothetical protein
MGEMEVGGEEAMPDAVTFTPAARLDEVTEKNIEPLSISLL